MLGSPGNGNGNTEEEFRIETFASKSICFYLSFAIIFHVGSSLSLRSLLSFITVKTRV